MRRDLLDLVPLLCPGCRAAGRASALRVEGGARESRAGSVIEAVLRCPHARCGRAFPVIDGVPVLVDALLDYLREERTAILRRRDLGPEIGSLLAEAVHDEDEDALRARDLATYGKAHDAIRNAALFDFVRDSLALRAPARRPGKWLRGLDAGCAVGGFTRLLAGAMDLAVGVDLSFDMARDALERSATSPEMRARTAFAVASIEAPPFADATFDVVLALNVLDAVEHPMAALSAIGAVLRPGGLLVLTTPFHWRDARTAREERIADADLGRALAEVGLEIEDDRPRIEWRLPLGARHAEVFHVRGIAARRLSARRKARAGR